MKAKPSAKILRRVYAYCSNKDNTIWYIGSSHCSLKSLEYNHRNALIKWPNENHTTFRKSINKPKYKKGIFLTVIEKVCTQNEIEDLEGQLIRCFRPTFNIDLDPVGSSYRYGRYTIADHIEDTLKSKNIPEDILYEIEDGHIAWYDV